ncbi:MAG TPA: hypothetical protein VFP58_01230, partial [Candidatus Eisenbacteria bacterium]|nr:hypothetical protein [Candidatus Eisenbacteria bacterium]
MISPEPKPERTTASPSSASRTNWPSFRSRGPNVPPARRKICLSLSGGGLSGAFYEIGCLAAL